MNDEQKRSPVEIFRPNEPLPGRGLDPRLPHPEVPLPPGFPITGFFRLLRLGSAMRISDRYAAALHALDSAYRAAAGVQDAQFELHRAIGRLRDKDTVLATDQAIRDEQRIRAEAARDEERIRAEVRKFRAELDLYRAKAALDEYKNSDTQGAATPGNKFAKEVEEILKRSFGESDAA